MHEVVGTVIPDLGFAAPITTYPKVDTNRLGSRRGVSSEQGLSLAILVGDRIKHHIDAQERRPLCSLAPEPKEVTVVIAAGRGADARRLSTHVAGLSAASCR